MEKFDASKLTLGETAYIEKMGGYALASLQDEAAPKGNMLAACAVVQARRNGRPDFSWNEATALTLPEALEILGIDTAATTQTTEAADEIATTEAPAPKASRSGKTSPETPTK
ncbi:hypothetical protein E5344_12180 [Microbacterium laevaniformans]|uniref:Uncharacterized protein n=1 Tax=Microbacterium laevaniformans TaxID=36807 RepID=A0A4S2D1R3_9MICO|nr:hypothetical protein [Microbacterium laevaniformans]TGY35036.1 hypothetical protein E5344_12180 [Microbacterium laevaniformans]